MNFVATYEEGQKGKLIGLPMGKGLETISRAIGGVQKGKNYIVGAAPKVGKSTLVDSGFVIEPCLYVLHYNGLIDRQLESLTPSTPEYVSLQASKIDLDIIYLSYEIDRVGKEFDFCCHFLYRDYGLDKVILEPGKFYKGDNFVPISSEYLMGQLVYDSEDINEREVIKIPKDVEDRIKAVYLNRILPLFGKYNSEGEKLTQGLIKVIENKDNPTGIRNDLLAYAETKGKFLYSEVKNKHGQVFKRKIGYTYTNPNQFTLVVTDHIRKLIPERTFNLKQTVDKYSEYTVELRNLCKFSFVHIVHLNRAMSDVQRRKLDDDKVYPTSDDIKETGEEKHNYVFICLIPSNVVYL